MKHLLQLNPQQLLEFYRILSNEAIYAIMVFDQEGKACLYANKMACELLEIPPQSDLCHFPFSSLCPNKNSRKEFRPLSFELFHNEGLFQDVVMIRQNNTQLITNLNVKKITLTDQSLTLLMFQDITFQKKLQRDLTTKQIEIKSAYEELLFQNRQLKDLDIAKDHFIALTTHELRTPLSAMVASAEILKLGLFDSEEQKKEFIEMIYEQGHRLTDLVNDILDFAKIQAGKTDLYVEYKDLYQIVPSEVESFEKMAEASQLTIQFLQNHGSDDHCYCYFDEMRLRQVLANLLTNAIKYNRPKGNVTVWIEEKEDMAQVHVKDTGKGISPEDQPKIFNEFETLGKVALHHHGTGLGMPISKRLMEAHGGKIELSSQLNLGTTFWISIPKTKILDPHNYRKRNDSSSDLVA